MTQKDIPGYVKRTVIALKISVMHLVVKIDQTKSVPVFQEQLVKPGMRDHRQKDVKLQVKNHMQRMRGYKEIDQYQPKKDRMFNWMHRQPQLWPNIGIAVMHRIGQPVERRPVQSAVSPVKIEAVSDCEEEKDRYKLSWILRPIGKRQINVGKAPSHQRLINRPSN